MATLTLKSAADLEADRLQTVAAYCSAVHAVRSVEHRLKQLGIHPHSQDMQAREKFLDLSVQSGEDVHQRASFQRRDPVFEHALAGFDRGEPSAEGRSHVLDRLAQRPDVGLDFLDPAPEQREVGGIVGHGEISAACLLYLQSYSPARRWRHSRVCPIEALARDTEAAPICVFLGLQLDYKTV